MEKFVSSLDSIKTNTCNFCKDSEISKFDTTFDSRYNIYCCHEGKKIVDVSVKPKHYIECPDWCPKKINKRKTMTYQEKIEQLKKIQPFVKWDDIKENQVYHIPQIPGEERKDIIIISKHESYCTYKILNSTFTNVSYTIYPHTLLSRFLVPHKIQKIQVIRK